MYHSDCLTSTYIFGLTVFHSHKLQFINKAFGCLTDWNLLWKITCFDQVTAVGHAAILAAIQRYVPALVSDFLNSSSSGNRLWR